MVAMATYILNRLIMEKVEFNNFSCLIGYFQNRLLSSPLHLIRRLSKNY